MDIVVRYPIHVELIFDRDTAEAGYWARALGHSIFTGSGDMGSAQEYVLEATTLHFEDQNTKPRIVQLHYVKDELIAK